MAVNPTVAKYLTEARRELVQQRDALTRDIEDLDRILQGHKEQPSAQVTALGTAEEHNSAHELVIEFGAVPAPPMEDEILKVLNSQDREFATADVVRALTSRFNWQASSVRSLIGKMARDGQIQKTRRGVYRAWPTGAVPSLADVEDPEDASDPAEAGPEDRVTAAGEGGDSLAQADQDHGDDLAERDRDDQRGASVRGPHSG